MDVEIEWSLSVLLPVSMGVRDWLPWISWIHAANGWELCSFGNLGLSRVEYETEACGCGVGVLGYSGSQGLLH